MKTFNNFKKTPLKLSGIVQLTSSLKSFLLSLFLLLLFYQSNAQISVQTIGYWDKNESYEFEGSYKNYRVTGKDTIYKSDMTYDVQVNIKDSTADAYQVEWLYKNHQFLRGDKMAELISDPNDSVKIVFTTDELGAFNDVLNMDELLLYYKNKFETLERENKDVEFKTILKAMKIKFEDQNFIKNNAYKDLLTYYFFHGAKYDLNEEYSGNLQTGNNFGGASFDTDISIWLDEIDEENNTYVMRSYQKIDSIQLKKSVAKQLKMPIEEVPELSNETYIANRIHGSGWTTYMISTKTVESNGVKNIEEYILQMK